MKRDLVLVTLTAALTGFLVWEFIPRKPDTITIPVIKTVYDTVKVVPTWLNDSMRIWKSRKATTDTVELVISETIIDTQFLPITVGCDSSAIAARPKKWPILSYNSGGNFGDTAFVTVFDIRTGQLGASRVFTAGILTGIEADSNTTPRITYKPFPSTKRGATLWDKVKWTGVGFAGCSVYNMVKP